MLKTRAITISFRFYFGLTVAALVGAFFSAIGTNGGNGIMNQILGPLTLGWKGAVGDHLGYTLFVGVAVASGAVAGILTAYRDADASAEAQAVGLDSVPLTRAPAGTNYWPVVAAFAVIITVAGLAISRRDMALAGGFILAAAALMWTVRAWAERATGDDTTNLELYHQVMEPIRLPLVALLLVAIMVGGFSRILLTLPNRASSAVVFAVLAVLIGGGAVLIAWRPKVSRSVIVIALLILGLIILAGGVFGAARGAREFEHHDSTGQVTEGG